MVFAHPGIVIIKGMWAYVQELIDSKAGNLLLHNALPPARELTLNQEVQRTMEDVALWLVYTYHGKFQEQAWAELIKVHTVLLSRWGRLLRTYFAPYIL